MRRRTRAWISALAFLIALAPTAPAWGDAIGVVSQKLSTASLTVPAIYPSSVSATNGASPRVAGRADAGDKASVVFAGALNQSTLCSAWANTTTTKTVTGIVRINDNAGSTGNDTLTVVSVPAASCSAATVRFGTLDLGSPGYVSAGNITYTSSSIAITLGTTLTITLGTVAAGGGTAAIVGLATNAVYAPDVAIADTSGRTASPSTAKNNAVQF